ncbi:molecular chaperone [Streptomyces clavuligerus]|nr:molecular chaperone [Streptomyces clavuligerus]
MAWVLLIIAGLLEVGWSIGMKFTEGFTKLWPSVFTGLGIVASMFLLAQAAKTLPIGRICRLALLSTIQIIQSYLLSKLD